MPLRLIYHGETTLPVEVEGLIPDWTADKSLAEIERFEVFHGNCRLQLAELFTVMGDPSDQRIEFEGDLSSVHWIGAHATCGQIYVHGSAGRHVGSQMRGGEIHVEGNVGGWLGCEMRAGQIHVRGNAGDLVGGAYRGSIQGMTGGTILVDGQAGHEIGLLMRRGMIAIGGTAGEMLGFNMLAGTVLVFGECGIRPGAGMRRGTIGLFGPNPPPLLSSFQPAGVFRPRVIPLMLRYLQDQGFCRDESLFSAEFDLFYGDMVSLGKGEIFRKHTAD